ncbi:MAG TPA: hypothetical protein VHT72_09025, partial [Puia sp.]|nr:hypothetical protein [Puia sp.]
SIRILKTNKWQRFLCVISYICAEMNKVILHCTVIYLALIILIRMMAMPISLIDYSLNKNFIAENLCENRFKSEMHCGGSCFLNKQLAKGNDNQNTENRQSTVKILIIDFFESAGQLQFGCSHLPVAHPFAANTQRVTENYRNLLFRPPIS